MLLNVKRKPTGPIVRTWHIATPILLVGWGWRGFVSTMSADGGCTPSVTVSIKESVQMKHNQGSLGVLSIGMAPLQLVGRLRSSV